MDTKNLEFLRRSLVQTGFGEFLMGEVEKNMRIGFSEFSIQQQAAFHSGKMNYNLHFRDRDMMEEPFYRLTRYEAILTKFNGQKVGQVFFVDNGWGYTKEQSFNLLDGRAVRNFFEKSEKNIGVEWNALDFWNYTLSDNFQIKSFRESDGFNLMTALERLPIDELKNEIQRQALVESLEKGNLQLVTFDMNGIAEKRYIAANPELRGIKVYDQSMKRITTDFQKSQSEIKHPSPRDSNRGHELSKKRESKGKGMGL